MCFSSEKLLSVACDRTASCCMLGGEIKNYLLTNFSRRNFILRRAFRAFPINAQRMNGVRGGGSIKRIFLINFFWSCFGKIAVLCGKLFHSVFYPHFHFNPQYEARKCGIFSIILKYLFYDSFSFYLQLTQKGTFRKYQICLGHESDSKRN